MERLLLTVSPFDGVNRIRFKGSLDCGIRIADCELKTPHSEIRIPQFADSQPRFLEDRGSPETLFDFQAVETILGLLTLCCKLFASLVVSLSLYENWPLNNLTQRGPGRSAAQR